MCVCACARRVHLPTDFLGPLVYVMTIYGPFVTIVFETKRRACKGRFDWLPVSSRRST